MKLEEFKKYKYAIGWSIFQSWLLKILNMIAFVGFVRNINSVDIGVYTAIVLFTGLIFLFVDFGMCEALVKKENLTQSNKEFVFTSNIVIAVVLATLIFIFGDSIQEILKIKNSDYFSIAVILILIFYAYTTAKLAIIRREFNYKKIVKFNLISTLISIGVAYFLLFLNLNSVALMIYAVVYYLVLSILLTTKNYEINLKKLNFASNSEIFKYGRARVLTQILFFINARSPEIAIASLFGPKILATYMVGIRIYDALMQLLVYSVIDVAHNIFSRHASNLEEIKNLYLSAINRSSVLVVPIFILIAIISEILISQIFGENWISSAKVLTFMCCYGVVQCYENFNTALLNALNLPKLALKLSLFKTVIIILALYIYGSDLHSIMITFFIFQSIFVLVSMILVNSVVEGVLMKVLEIAYRTFLCVLLPALIGVMSKFFFATTNFSLLLQLCLIVTSYISMYLIIFYLINKKNLLNDILS